MKFNSVVTNIEQDFTVSEKALGARKLSVERTLTQQVLVSMR